MNKIKALLLREIAKLLNFQDNPVLLLRNFYGQAKLCAFNFWGYKRDCSDIAFIGTFISFLRSRSFRWATPVFMPDWFNSGFAWDSFQRTLLNNFFIHVSSKVFTYMVSVKLFYLGCQFIYDKWMNITIPFHLPKLNFSYSTVWVFHTSWNLISSTPVYLILRVVVLNPLLAIVVSVAFVTTEQSRPENCSTTQELSFNSFYSVRSKFSSSSFKFS